MSARVYVEGGGNHNKALTTRCREAFEILARLDPERVTGASPHARRLVDVLRAKL